MWPGCPWNGQSALKQPTAFTPLWLANLGKGQTTHECTHTQAQCTKHLFRTGLLAQHAQHSFHPMHLPAAARSAPDPLDLSTRLKQTDPSCRSTKGNRESNQGKKSILFPRSTSHFIPLPTSKHRSWQELGSGPPWANPLSPEGSRGKLQLCSGNMASLTRKEKTPKNRRTFPFSTWKILVQYQFGGLDKPRWGQGGEEARRHVAGPYVNHH